MWKMAFIYALCCLISIPAISTPRIESYHPALTAPDPAGDVETKGRAPHLDRATKSPDVLGKTNPRIIQSTLPLYFIRNDGQLDSRVKYYARSAGQTIYLTTSGVYFDFSEGSTPTGRQAEASRMSARMRWLDKLHQRGTVQHEVVRLHPLESRAGFEILPQDQQQARFNYFLGDNPKKWRPNVPSFAAVLYKEVYLGVDIKFYSSAGKLEYDVILKPGADLSQVKLAYGGIQGLSKQANGDLLVQLQWESFLQKRPRIYQSIAGRITEVAGDFVVIRNELGKSARQLAFGFQTAAYDKSVPLIIDPQIQYSTLLGGEGDDFADGIAVDASGSAYIAGETHSVYFPTTIGAYSTICNKGAPCNQDDAFISKISPDGTSLIYSTFIGGSLGDGCGSLRVDSFGNVYAACGTSSTDFPKVHPFQSKLKGGNDGAVVKLNPQGSQLLYSSYFGGGGDDDVIFGIELDAQGDIFLAGSTNSLNFPVQDALQPAFGGPEFDGFVSELTPKGNALVYSTYLGGSSWDAVLGLTVDSAGAAYVTGYTFSPDFPTTPGAFDTVCGSGGSCNNDAFVAKLQPGGLGLAYSTFLGGTGIDDGNGIAIDSFGCAYIAGDTLSDDFPLRNPLQPTKGAVTDGFVTKLTPDGSDLIYSTYLGGNGSDVPGAITVDSAGAVYVTGWEMSTDFPVVDPLPVECGGDAFVTKIDPAGDALMYSTCLGGNWYDQGNDIAVDSAGAVYVSGQTVSIDFPVKNALQATFGGGVWDGFVTKLQCYSIDDVHVLESAGAALFTAHLCAPGAFDATVDYATSDGSAVAGINYIATSGTLMIPAGSTDETISVPLIHDNAFNPDATFFLNLTNATNVTLTRNQATATILDVDSLFYDDFLSGVVNWDGLQGQWNEKGGLLQGTGKGVATAFVSVPWFPSGASGCSVCSIEMDVQTAGGLRSRVMLEGWYQDQSNRVELIISEESNKWVIKQRSNGVVVAKKGTHLTIDPEATYHIKLSYDGVNFQLFVDGSQLITLPSGAVPTGNFGLKVRKTTATYGPIRIY